MSLLQNEELKCYGNQKECKRVEVFFALTRVVFPRYMTGTICKFLYQEENAFIGMRDSVEDLVRKMTNSKSMGVGLLSALRTVFPFEGGVTILTSGHARKKIGFGVIQK